MDSKIVITVKKNSYSLEGNIANNDFQIRVKRKQQNVWTKTNERNGSLISHHIDYCLEDFKLKELCDTIKELESILNNQDHA